MSDSGNVLNDIDILLVDDNGGILDQAKMFLEQENDSFVFETVKDSEEALDLLESEFFDCVVSDYQMPILMVWIC